MHSHNYVFFLCSFDFQCFFFHSRKHVLSQRMIELDQRSRQCTLVRNESPFPQYLIYTHKANRIRYMYVCWFSTFRRCRRHSCPVRIQLLVICLVLCISSARALPHSFTSSRLFLFSLFFVFSLAHYPPYIVKVPTILRAPIPLNNIYCNICLIHIEYIQVWCVNFNSCELVQLNVISHAYSMRNVGCNNTTISYFF